MRSMIWSAVLVHLKGRALSFQSLIHSWSALVSSSREQKTPRSRQRRCNSASHRSTWLIHEEYVGVKCSTKRGWAASQRCTTGALWVERLSHKSDVGLMRLIPTPGLSRHVRAVGGGGLVRAGLSCVTAPSRSG